MSGSGLVLRYSLFAALATAGNVLAQMFVLGYYQGSHAFALAVAVGTGVGLIIKYLLDKRWIFGDKETGLRAHSRKFGLYTVMGIVTTLIFWITETVFHLASDQPYMTYVGAVIGLAIGYFIKYQLDRRFVFRGAANEAVGLGELPAR